MNCPSTQTFTPDQDRLPFQLLVGASLPEITVAYETWGQLNPERNNAVWVTPGLSATPHLASHADDPTPGWWEAMVGPGRAIDTHRWFVICANMLGGCFGTTGPTSQNPATGRHYGPDFPTVTIEDMVKAYVALQDHLGIARLHCVLGASMGGMLALQWAAMYPDRLNSACSMAAPGRSYAFSIAWRAVQRRIVTSDPRFEGGHYPPGNGPVAGLNLARAVGILSYRSPAEFDPRFGRQLVGEERLDPENRFQVEAYLEHNARKFGNRFDANSYLLLARAMDYFDLGRGAESYEAGVARITVPSLVVGFSSDQLFPSSQQKELASLLKAAQRPVELLVLDTPYGHDAFLIETETLGARLAGFLDGSTNGS